MNLQELAESIMDAYYQNFKTDEDFFTQEHFAFLCIASYYSLLQVEYEKSYATNRQQGRNVATIPDDWYITETVKVEQEDEEYRARLHSPVFSFRLDQQGLGLGYVFVSPRQRAIRITLKELYKLKLEPYTKDLYCWLCSKQDIAFASSVTIPEELTVMYIPLLKPEDEEAEIPDSLADTIMKNVLQYLLQAKQGRPFVNMTNDQNPNINPDGEIMASLRRLLTISPKE